MRPSPWIVRRPDAPDALRLYCFCYAGGSPASFLAWQDALGPSVAVHAIQLPGRGARFNEAPPDRFADLIATLAAEIAQQGGAPFAFFGHSLGGLLAFELARYQQAHGQRLPQHLFISGCAAARLRSPPKGLHRLADAALLEKLRDYNGTPPEVLANAELMDLLLPAIRADFALVDNYCYRPAAALPMPISVLAGTQEAYDSPAQVHGWGEETSAGCAVHWFEGDHFFIQPRRADVLACIARQLASTTAAAGFSFSMDD